VHQVLLGDDTIANAVNDNRLLFVFLEDILAHLFPIILIAGFFVTSDSDLW
jgi:choline/glycine/proline betaine transport protein